MTGTTININIDTYSIYSLGKTTFMIRSNTREKGVLISSFVSETETCIDPKITYCNTQKERHWHARKISFT